MLSGKIQKPLSDSISISYNDNRIAYYPKEFFAAVDRNGNFSMSFPLPEHAFMLAELKHGNKLAELILQAGDSLVMTVNTGHFDSSISYQGRGSEIQNFVAQHTLQKGRVNQYSVKLKSCLIKEPDDFLKAIDKEKNKETEFLDKNKGNLPLTFGRYWNAFYQYYNYFFMEQYPQMHEIVKLRRYTDTIPPVNYSVIKELPYSFNDELLAVPPYLLYLTGMFDTRLKAAGYNYTGNDVTSTQKYQDSVTSLAYALLPDKSAEYYVAQNIYAGVKTQPLERTKLHLTRFTQHWPESEYYSTIHKQVSMAEKLAPGQPAPDIDITGPDGRTKRLSDLKGTVVYLGFWAGWCRQCVADMLAEQKVKTLIRNRPLTFVYVSINTDTAMDRTIINKYKIDGFFTNVTGGWYADALQQYGVQSLPAYFLIDEDGKFALQNTPAPAQSTELILAIEKLFK